MNARVERAETAKRAVPVKRIKTQKVVVNFDVKRFHAPFLLRCGALLIDYILLALIPVVSILIARYSGLDGARLLNGNISNTGWLITVLVGATNFFILPMFSGQSIGKMLTGLKVVNSDGTLPSFGGLFLRHLIGYPVTILTLGLGFIYSVFNENGRALHDFIAGTVVVYGKSRIEKKVAEKKKSSKPDKKRLPGGKNARQKDS